MAQQTALTPLYDADGRTVVLQVGPERVSGWAVASLVFGLLWLFWLGSLIAIRCGEKARYEIECSNGRVGGFGLAVAGEILGWVAVVPGFVLLMAAIAAVR